MKKTMILLSVLLALLTVTASAQIDKMRNELNDAMAEQQKGLLTLHFSDAQTGKPVPNATVDIQGIGSFRTGSMGTVRFPIPAKDGIYPARVHCKGYIPVDLSLDVVAGTIFHNRFSLSKSLPIGQLRIVLEWNKKPSDIDAHFVKKGGYHISYRNMTASSDGLAVLDRDDRDGYGPETITVKQVDKNAEYRFYVFDYSDRDHPRSDKLSRSGAIVRVYGNNKLLKTFEVPTDTEGDFWQVFSITHGQINAVNNVVKKLNF